MELRPFRGIIYCDTLAWDPPSNLVNVVNNFTSHILWVEDFNESHLSVAHSPLATSRTGHFCEWRCHNYPLQTCSDVCGVIVLINAALAALNRSFFQNLIGLYEKEKIFIQRLSIVGCSWVAETVSTSTKSTSTTSIKYNEYKCKTSTYQKSYFVRTTRIWNCLSSELNLNCQSVNSFKSVLLEYYFAALNFYDAEDPRCYKTVCLKCNSCRSLARNVICCN